MQFDRFFLAIREKLAMLDFTTPKPMTFEHLVSRISAVRLRNLNYDMIRRTISVDLYPEYGIKPEMERKVFKLTFNTCIYVGNRCEDGIDIDDEFYEYIDWGIIEKKEDLLQHILTTTDLVGLHPNPTWLDFDTYTGYFFLDPLSASILIIVSSECVVKEITPQPVAEG